jgi:hypothetical protein
MTENISKPKREQLLEILDEMIKNYETLPQSGKIQPLVQYDMESHLLLEREILKTIHDDIKRLFELIDSFATRQSVSEAPQQVHLS